MVQTHPAWLEHQRKLWLRPDWQKWLRPDWQSWLPPNSDLYPKPQPDARKDDSELYAGPVDIAAEREFLFRMQSELAAVKAEIKFRRLLRTSKAGFRPDQQLARMEPSGRAAGAPKGKLRDIRERSEWVSRIARRAIRATLAILN